ncbi:signal peptidase I [Deinococcus navajonensis]|uniref:Signal peptidase I n=1 Tax=Deinococcus navajonensis TaxID=309884 RepID=A0ABV8XLS8_9DEIO
MQASSDTTTPASSPPLETPRWWRHWLLGILLPVYLLTTFVGTLARVDGQSMAETLHSGDLLLLLKYPRWLAVWGVPLAYPRPGDVVIFKAPADSPYSFETVWGVAHRPYNVKRVMALAGDEVAIRDGEVVVNGRVVFQGLGEEGFLNPQAPLRVPPGKIWVLGDNRRLGESLDSRAYGPVDLRDVAGPANLRLWPHPGLIGPHPER